MTDWDAVRLRGSCRHPRRARRRPVPLLVAVGALAAAGGAGGAPPPPPRVAVIGAGFGGAFAAREVRRHLGEEAVIDVLERGSVGGRVQHILVEGDPREIGAEVFFGGSRYLKRAAREAGLELAAPHFLRYGVSLWDGARFVLENFTWKTAAFKKMWRYGKSLYQLRALVTQAVEKLDAVYRLQEEEGRAYAGVEELLRAAGLYGLTQVSLEAYLAGNLGKDSAVMTELVNSLIKMFYNQDTEVNALAGLLALAPVVTDDMLCVKGGNSAVVDRLLGAAGANVRVGASIEEIERHGNGSYALVGAVTREVDGDTEVRRGDFGPYDRVIVAAPLEFTGMKFLGMPDNPPRVPPRIFQSTFVTYIVGRLNDGYFNARSVPFGNILVTKEANDGPFSAILMQKQLANGERLYQIFSPVQLSPQIMQQLFTNVSWLGIQEWEAYPKFSPPEVFAPAELADGLYYLNAGESAASSLEMAAIFATNVGLLVKDSFAAPPPPAAGDDGEL